MSERSEFKLGACVMERNGAREPLWVRRYTAHGLVEVRDGENRIGWLNPDDVVIYQTWSPTR